MTEWVDVIGFPGYKVSSSGLVQGPRAQLRQSTDRDGYLHVILWIKCKGYNRRVNRLVCEAFHGLPPTPDFLALHKDGVKSNNTASNLYWGTHRQNMDDMIQMDTSPKGPKNGNTRLTWELVRQIRQDFAEGLIPYKLAAKYGITHKHATLIVRNVMWKE